MRTTACAGPTLGESTLNSVGGLWAAESGPSQQGGGFVTWCLWQGEADSWTVT